MRQQNVIVFSSGKNKGVAHEIARGLGGDVCRAVVGDEFFDFRLLTKEIDLFRNTLAQFLHPGADGACHVTDADVEAGRNRIFFNEISFAEPIGKQTTLCSSAV